MILRREELKYSASNDLDEDIKAFDLAIQALEQQLSEDYISRKATVKRLRKAADYMNEKEIGLGSPYAMAAKFIQDNKDEFPSVTPQPKIGRWVEEKINEWTRKVCCSECGGPPPFVHVSNGDIYSAGGYGVLKKTKFCPNCGAKMEV